MLFYYVSLSSSSYSLSSSRHTQQIWCLKTKCIFNEWICPQSNYISTALSRPNMADNPQGGAGLTGLLPWEQRSLPPSLSLTLSASVGRTHTHRVTCTLIHTQYYSGIFLALWSVLRWREAGNTERRRRGHSTSVLDGEYWLTGYCLFTYCVLKQKSALYYGCMGTAVCGLALLQDGGTCHMFFSLFSCVFFLLSSWKLSS